MSDDLGMLLRTAAYLAFEDGTNDYTTPALAAARIAELETSLRRIIRMLDHAAIGQHLVHMRKASSIAIAALAGGKDE